MSPGTPLAVVIAIMFFVPGAILRKVIEFTAKYPSRQKVEILECFVLSCLNYLLAIPLVWILLCYWPAGLDLSNPDTIRPNFEYLFWWLLLVFLLPTLLGMTLGLLSRRETPGVLRRLGISILHPAPTAWDYTFARNKKYWTRVELFGGQIIEGMFNSSSLASSEKDDKDIFLEEVFEFDEESKEYTPLEQNQGIWINSKAIQSIIFFDVD